MGHLRIEGHAAACELAAGDRPGHCHWCGNPRPSHRRRWCSDDCGRAFYDNHRWAQARQAAKERAGFRCERCGTVPLTGLEVHHRIEVDLAEGYDTLSCAHHQENLEVLCPYDHRAEHSFRHEVDRILVWADGAVSRQLQLPISA